jgi:hypothetical protein
MQALNIAFQFASGPKQPNAAAVAALDELNVPENERVTAADMELIAAGLNARPVLDLATQTLPETVLPEASDAQLANLKAFVLTVIASPEGKAAIQASLNS